MAAIEDSIAAEHARPESDPSLSALASFNLKTLVGKFDDVSAINILLFGGVGIRGRIGVRVSMGENVSKRNVALGCVIKRVRLFTIFCFQIPENCCVFLVFFFFL